MSSIARDRTRLSEVIARIESLDEPALEESRQRQELLTKPPGSLGRLERLATQLAGITSNPRPRVPRKAMLTAAQDLPLEAFTPAEWTSLFDALVADVVLDADGRAMIRWQQGSAESVGPRVA